MSKYIRLRNVTEEHLVAIFQGIPVRFEPHAERVLPAVMAEKVKHDLGTKVEEQGERPAVHKPASYFGKTQWLANVSGDPDEPATIVVDKKTNKVTGEEAPVYANNQRARPTPVTVFCNQREEPIQSDIGTFTFTWPPEHHTLKAGERRELPHGIAETFLREETLAGPQSGKIIKARAPQESDPSMSWSLEQLTAYFMLVEPTAPAFKMKSEDQIRAENTAADGKLDANAFAVALEDQKYIMYKRCFKRAVDPRYPVPSLDDLDKYMNREARRASKPSDEAKTQAKQLLSSP